MTFEEVWLVSLAEELRSALRVRRIVFVHASAIHGTYFDEVSAQVNAAASVSAIGLVDFPEDRLIELVSKYAVLFVRDVEKVKATAEIGVLNRLRACIQRLAQDGLDICLVSADSRETYPSVPGSSIILDSSSYALPPCLPRAEDQYKLSTVPAIYEDPSGDFRELYRATLGQVSIHALIDLDRAVYEMGLEAHDFPSELAPEVQEELRCAGILTRRNGDVALLLFCVPARFQNFKLALADAISKSIEAPPWLSLASDDLFEIERLIRSRLRQAAIGRHGDKWRRHVTSSEVEVQIIDHARRDGHFAVSAVDELRDPLEWLSLGQLLDIVIMEKFGTIGPTQAFWSKFRAEVVPIRNRVGHMRLVSRDDQRSVRVWRRMLERMVL